MKSAKNNLLCKKVTKDAEPDDHGRYMRIYVAEFTHSDADNNKNNDLFFPTQTGGSDPYETILKVATRDKNLFRPGREYLLEISEAPGTSESKL